jgi:hypothetical protein
MMDHETIKSEWRDRVASIWISAVFLAYLATIGFERGERLKRIWNSIFNS